MSLKETISKHTCRYTVGSRQTDRQTDKQNRNADNYKQKNGR